MNVPLAERLTSQFYNWELRGRGWHSFELSVDLEPPFYPFFLHTVQSPPLQDDGYRRGLIGRLVNSLFKMPQAKVLVEPDELPFTAYPFIRSDCVTILSVTVPKGYDINHAESLQLLVMLSNSRYPISFEIIADRQNIFLQFVCQLPDATFLQSQIEAYFPGCVITEGSDHIETLLENDATAWIQEYGLRDEFMRPLVPSGMKGIDPYVGFFASLDDLKEHEAAIIQILFKGALNPWAESIMRSVTGNDGRSSFFADAPEMPQLAKEKISSPLHAVVMRTMAIAPDRDAVISLGQRLQTAFVRVYPNSASTNTLIPLDPSNADIHDSIDDIILRESQRLGMLLNTEELARVVHLPDASVLSAKLVRNTRKTKSAPPEASGHPLILGTNSHRGKTIEVGISNAQRLKHMHVIGATGTGKSTFLNSLISQDMANGEGLCLIDPHGDLVEDVLNHIPVHRIKDVVIIDPADTEFPIGFNILSAHSEIEKDILSSDLVSVFKRLSTSWGDQMNSVLANAILAFVESNSGGTLLDLRRFLVEKSFRDNFLRFVSDPAVRYYWQKEYPLLKTSSIGSILTRLDAFLRPKIIRNMVGQKKGLDFEQILDSGKIVLAKLSQGLIGNENSYLLGTFFVTKIYQAAMARQAKGKESRRDFFLYIDEFQNFITPSMTAILSGARKYHLGMVLAHQDMQQLQKYDSELASSVVSNAGTRICFRLGDLDAKRFESGFAYFDREDLESLNTGEAICRIERPDHDFSLDTSPVLTKEQANSAKQAAITHSHTAYGSLRSEVEQELASTMTDIPPAEAQVLEEKETKQKKERTKSSSVQEIETSQLSAEEELETAAAFIRQKEERRHRYLQSYIKKMAEVRGFKSQIEFPTPDGSGKVDVHLEQNEKRIACEICVTTPAQWELHNIQKCLAAGYDLVVEISDERKILDAIQRQITKSIPEDMHSRILCLDPDAFISHLDAEIAKETVTETRIKGYRVKVEYNTEAGGIEQKKKAIDTTVTNALKKKKRD